MTLTSACPHCGYVSGEPTGEPPVRGMDPEQLMARLEPIASSSWVAFEEAQTLWPTFVTPHSRPVAWFGDTRAYASSPVKVVTVGLNPSQIEFPVDGPDLRFPAGHKASGPTTGYRRSLNDYFKVAPYWAWFNTFRCVLRGLGAGFELPNGRSTAVHTDLGSPVVTSPTWSKLTPAARSGLGGKGIELWHDLVTVLRPQVVLVSVARRHLENIAFSALSPWSPLCMFPLPGGGSYTVLLRWFDIDGLPTAVVWGQAAVKPFQLIPQLARHELGHRALVAITTPPGRGG